MKSSRSRARMALPALLLAPLVILAASCAESVSDSGACEEGLTQCDGNCVDIQRSADNCGACDLACPTGTACENGACVASCSSGATDCGGSCVDLATDPKNCGACGVACPEGTACEMYVCRPPCPESLLRCEDTCVDAQNDPENCGDCEVACAEGEACVEGVCGGCGGGLEKCSGQCIDTETSTQHCGGCDLPCAPGYLCQAGACANPCPAGQVPCSGQCVDTQSSNSHCGSCNNACATGQQCQAGACECTGGVCGVCSLTDLPSMVPQTVNGSTSNAPDGLSPSCGFSSSDVAYSFTAPADGSYRFDTMGSSYNTALALLDPSCGEIDCNDDHGASYESRLSLDMTAGQMVYVVVDGSFDEGPFVLHVVEVQPPICPVADLGSTVPQTIDGTTLGAGSALDPSCGGSGMADQSYTFTAPADGSYLFNTAGSSITTVLQVLDASCNGQELACSDGLGGSLEPKVVLPMTQGQTVVVAVEGAYEEGDFTLSIAEAPAPVCPTGDLGSTVPATVTGTTINQGDALSPTCNQGFSSADASYTFTAPADGTYSFDTSGASFQTAVHVRDASCAGPELVCAVDLSGSGAFTYATLTAGQTVVVSVEGLYGIEGNFELHVNEYTPPPCPMQDLGSAVPQTVNGDTTGFDNNFEPIVCGSNGGPEMTYSFTAPASGTYIFDTIGTSWDTILHVRNGSCGGAEIACNDDSSGVQSEVTLSLTAGQTVVIMVDGFSNSAEGPFTLHVHQ